MLVRGIFIALNANFKQILVEYVKRCVRIVYSMRFESLL